MSFSVLCKQNDTCIFNPLRADKNESECRLLKLSTAIINANIIDHYNHRGTPCGPRLDCSYSSSLIGSTLFEQFF